MTPEVLEHIFLIVVTLGKLGIETKCPIGIKFRGSDKSRLLLAS